MSEYVPAELRLFDVVICDETSQSDSTLLPGLLRGKQWSIVGDGKQVSPTEGFVAEAVVEQLRATLAPANLPNPDLFLPGQSVMDLCAQGFPHQRLLLEEHFRCSPEFISFCNESFYNSKLRPLRIPTAEERLTPSIVDVKVPNGCMVGKSNPAECKVIVELVQEELLRQSNSGRKKRRSIGIINWHANHIWMHYTKETLSQQQENTEVGD